MQMTHLKRQTFCCQIFQIRQHLQIVYNQNWVWHKRWSWVILNFASIKFILSVFRKKTLSPVLTGLSRNNNLDINFFSNWCITLSDLEIKSLAYFREETPPLSFLTPLIVCALENLISYTILEEYYFQPLQKDMLREMNLILSYVTNWEPYSLRTPLSLLIKQHNYMKRSRHLWHVIQFRIR